MREVRWEKHLDLQWEHRWGRESLQWELCWAVGLVTAMGQQKEPLKEPLRESQTAYKTALETVRL